MGLLILNCRQAIALQRCLPTGTGVALSVLFMLGNLLLTQFLKFLCLNTGTRVALYCLCWVTYRYSSPFLKYCDYTPFNEIEWHIRQLV